MGWFFAGVIVTWLLTQVFGGARAAMFYHQFDGETYRDITKTIWGLRCNHQIVHERQVNGVHIGGCAHCPAIFVKVTDLNKVRYERA